MRVGDQVKVIYDPRPVFPGPKTFLATVVKITPKGMLRIETLEKTVEGKPRYKELFYPTLVLVGRCGGRYERYAKGWNTLWWEPLKLG